MPAEVINQEKSTAPHVQNDQATHDPRAGLTSDVDALLSVFDKIEAAVAADAVIEKSKAVRRRDDGFVVVPPHKSQTSGK